MIGTLAAFPFDITVPGGAAVAMAGTTMVTVQPTHRRRGALTAMMREHLDDARARAEPLAGLWASESVIYGRFGFGSATENDQVEMHGPRIDLREEGGNLRFVAAEESLDVLAGVYDSVWRHRPGMLSRTPAWWKNEILFDPTRWRDGASPLHAVLHESYGIPDGYALFRQKPEWGEAFPVGQVRVKELIAASDDAHTGLWRFLTSVDLFPEIRYSNAPVDDSLRWKVADPRRVTRKRWDALWLRVLDVPTALAARTYAADGSLRFRLTDRFRPDNDGVYELEVVEGSGVCERVRGAEPDLVVRHRRARWPLSRRWRCRLPRPRWPDRGRRRSGRSPPAHVSRRLPALVRGDLLRLSLPREPWRRPPGGVPDRRCRPTSGRLSAPTPVPVLPTGKPSGWGHRRPTRRERQLRHRCPPPRRK